MRHAGFVAATLLFALPAFAQDAATFSFSENHSGTFPRSITGDETIKVDLTRCRPKPGPPRRPAAGPP